MTSNDPSFRDDDLRNRFAALRREEEAGAPEFAVLLGGVAGHCRSVGKMIAIAVCLATVVAAVLLLRTVAPRPERGPGPPVASLIEWRAPTDFLLETPGRELLRSVPAIGVWHDYSKVARPKPKHPRVRTQALP